MSFGGASGNVQVDKQLQEELLAEDQKYKFQHQIHEFTDVLGKMCRETGQ